MGAASTWGALRCEVGFGVEEEFGAWPQPRVRFRRAAALWPGFKLFLNKA